MEPAQDAEQAPGVPPALVEDRTRIEELLRKEGFVPAGEGGWVTPELLPAGGTTQAPSGASKRAR